MALLLQILFNFPNSVATPKIFDPFGGKLVFNQIFLSMVDTCTYLLLLFQTTGENWFDPEVNEFYAHTSNPEKRKFGNHVNWLKMD